MIVHPPRIDEFVGKTIWHIEPTRGDSIPPSDELWIRGYYRSHISNHDLIAIWLITCLLGFSNEEISLPYAVSPEVRNTLGAMAGRSIDIGPITDKPRPIHEGTGICVLIRDEIDFLLAETFLGPEVIRVAVKSDADNLGRISTNAPIVTNAGWLTRRWGQKDSSGELATLVGLAPLYWCWICDLSPNPF